LRAIGLMSGTSLDGVHIALIETDGEAITAFGPTGHHPYTRSEQEVLQKALAEAAQLADRNARPGVLVEAETLVTRTHTETLDAFVAEHDIPLAEVDVVGFHGLTVLHRPRARLTVQIGDAKAIARRRNVKVVHDFRAADVEAGGQGMPLAPVFHCALVAALDRPGPIAVLTIGGVASVTYCRGDEPPVACDAGPGNALIDDFMRAHTGRALEDHGIMASRGKPNADFIARVLRDPFFAEPAPKSLDRNAFAFANLSLPELSLADGAATLSALTAAAVGRVAPHLPAVPASWIVTGAGARNRTLVRFLSDVVAPAKVATADEVGWSAAALDAQAIAYLAVRTLKGLPLSFPTTTGAPKPLTGGVIAHPGA
jgi:anhydro-N-acetylmuramic acid kinase